MNKTTILSVCVALAAAAGVVKATPITGNLDIAGIATFNAAPIGLGYATTVDSLTAFGAFGGTQDFAGISSASFSVPGGGWNLVGSTAIPGFVTFGSFSLELLSSTESAGTTLYVNDAGLAIVTGGGYDPTAYQFSFTATEPSPSTTGSFTFNLTSVPDGGTTIALLGGALTAVGLLRRKMLA
jgi:hypothetical protein